MTGHNLLGGGNLTSDNIEDEEHNRTNTTVEIPPTGELLTFILCCKKRIHFD